MDCEGTFVTEEVCGFYNGEKRCRRRASFRITTAAAHGGVECEFEDGDNPLLIFGSFPSGVTGYCLGHACRVSTFWYDDVGGCSSVSFSSTRGSEPMVVLSSSPLC